MRNVWSLIAQSKRIRPIRRDNTLPARMVLILTVSNSVRTLLQRLLLLSRDICQQMLWSCERCSLAWKLSAVVFGLLAGPNGCLKPCKPVLRVDIVFRAQLSKADTTRLLCGLNLVVNIGHCCANVHAMTKTSWFRSRAPSAAVKQVHCVCTTLPAVVA